jgi:hypothetical protein
MIKGLLFALTLISAGDKKCQETKIDKIEEMGKIILMEDASMFRIKNVSSNIAYGWIHGDPVWICETTIINHGAGETIYHTLRLK